MTIICTWEGCPQGEKLNNDEEKDACRTEIRQYRNEKAARRAKFVQYGHRKACLELSTGRKIDKKASLITYMMEVQEG